MKILKFLKLATLVGFMTVAAGCAGTADNGGVTEQEARQAIEAAKSALEQAKAMNVAWRDAGELIEKAEAAFAKADYAEAKRLADESRRMSENAMAQKKAEDERLAAANAAKSTTSGSYSVNKGDSLWRISGKNEVYGNPYQWPLIYKANSNKIKDADLIYPGQVLDIDSNPSAEASAAAVRHAKTRGAWSIGAVEESDKAYLAQ